MKIKQKTFRKIFAMTAMLCFLSSFINTTSVFGASDPNILKAVPVKGITTNVSQEKPKVLNLMNDGRIQTSMTLATEYVAVLTIFSDPSTGIINLSSGLSFDAGTHSFITVQNTSSSNLTIGNLSGIAPNKTISIGTWSSSVTTEHNGLWYNLEAYKIAKVSGAYSARVSLSWAITQAQLDTLNTYIRNHDSWSALSPCSSFAAGAWNSVVSSYQVSAGVPSTPKNLANSIKSSSLNYSTGASVPWDYTVYYAQGTGVPIASTVFK